MRVARIARRARRITRAGVPETVRARRIARNRVKKKTRRGRKKTLTAFLTTRKFAQQKGGD